MKFSNHLDVAKSTREVFCFTLSLLDVQKIRIWVVTVENLGTHLQELRGVAAELTSVLSKLDRLEALIAAAHVQSALEALQSLADFPQNGEIDHVARGER